MIRWRQKLRTLFSEDSGIGKKSHHRCLGLPDDLVSQTNYMTPCWQVAVCGAVDRFYPVMAFLTGICGCLMFMLVRKTILHLKGSFQSILHASLFT